MKRELRDGTAAERGLLQAMPPYPYLSSAQKELLQSIFRAEFPDDLAAERQRRQALGDAPSHLQGDIRKLGKWSYVEVLDAEYKDENKHLREAAIDHIHRYSEFVVEAYRFDDSP